jgi:hypothetical protein
MGSRESWKVVRDGVVGRGRDPARLPDPATKGFSQPSGPLDEAA